MIGKVNKEFIDLVNGRIPEVSQYDYHRNHIEDHMRILRDSDYKMCPVVVEAVMKHIDVHIEANIEHWTEVALRDIDEEEV